MTFSTSLALLFLATTLEPSPTAIRGSVEKALPLLKAAAETHAEKKSCFACHNQAYPMVAFDAACKLGFAMDEELRSAQVDHVREFVKKNRKEFDKGTGTGGQIDTAGWLLYTLEFAGEKPDDDTAAVAGYVLQRHADRKHWTTSSNRPPTQMSSFTSSYLAVRALKAWGTEKQKDAIANRSAAALAWAVQTPAKENEDRVYRLRLLHIAGATESVTKEAVRELLDAQQFDGGWAQKSDLPSDAYATATALAALSAVDTEAVQQLAYRRGVNYLLRTQLADGSWHVKTRSPVIQPYYESGFPHEKDQFISVTATSWAVVALAAAWRE
ncbi:prenyltransferase/squalene oxidase repeat-containing protein [Limnoglobus roseus]|uniref:Ankyrin repeat-like protein n=1 Tax=Limnoglobus roseus TaxID=2598579 RepID=A0A5C1AUP3_9BACT|nr:prenyltransferase/squalene oxidase repeat-containing protein [Limnoglobus roseus]QEL20974.1 Ankyrin repeat-like protein [Limnoglobus roseus]